jgi:malonate decarboxylase alpha subunit
MNAEQTPGRVWNRRRTEKQRRLAAANVSGKVIPTDQLVDALEHLLAPGDRVVLEGNNQKQADFLSRMLAEVNPQTIHDLHMIMPSVGRSEHLDLFEKGIARKLDFSFSGTQSLRISQLLEDGLLEIGAIHTYIELYSRLYVDLSPNVALIAGYKADRKGNLYTGPSTEDTPALVEAAAFHDGIVIAQVNELVDDECDLPRVDIPGSWIDYVVVADKPFFIEPLFTRDPRLIKQEHILMAMMAIKGIYAEHQVQSLNHGIGFNTAAIELLLPTYGEQLGLKGKICKHWTLNPHPTLIPAIESGWVESVHCFGGELGMEEYIRARPDVFFTGADGSMRSNRAFCQLAGQYAVDMFIGSTLQVDGLANSSTVTRGRFPDSAARRTWAMTRTVAAATPAWLNMITEPDPMQRGKKLVVQMVETFQAGVKPTFVEKLDAVEVAKTSGMPLAPVMIYGDDVTHVLTEEGIAYLYRAESLEERRAMVAAVAGITDIGLGVDARRVAELRRSGKVVYPEDIGIRRSDATRPCSPPAALPTWSNGPTVFTTHLPNSGAGNETPVTDSCRAAGREAGVDRPRLPDRRSAIKPEAGSGGQPGKRRPSRPVVRSDGALGAQPDPDVSAAGPAELAAPGRHRPARNRWPFRTRRRTADDGGHRRREYPSRRNLGAGITGERERDVKRQRQRAADCGHCRPARPSAGQRRAEGLQQRAEGDAPLPGTGRA